MFFTDPVFCGELHQEERRSFKGIMASGDKKIITCVEFGTRSVRVLHGVKEKDNSLTVLGFGQAFPGEAVRKGEVVQIRAAGEALGKALGEADKQAGHNIRQRRSVYCIINGPSVTGQQSEGSVLTGDDRKVRKNHIESAVQKAMDISPGQDQVLLNSFDSCFLLDSHTRVQDPEGENASRLTACLHIISVGRQQRMTLWNLLRDRGFEEDIHFVSAGIASVYGVLTEREKQEGVLLIDLGCGVTNYVAIRRDGILCSGVLGVGTDNIANDLSVGLELPIDYCRKMLLDKELFRRIGKGDAFLETPGPVAGTKRKIPLGSVETIIRYRLQEIFSILREHLEQQKCTHLIESGIVLCGGGSLIPPVRQLLASSMRMPLRPGNPQGFKSLPDEMDFPVCYTSLLGLLKYAANEEDFSPSSVKKMGDVLEGFGDQLFRKIKDFMGAFKL